MTTHFLKEGRSLCGLQTPPAAWPPGHDWVSFQDTELQGSVSCWRCICLCLGKTIPEEPKSPEHDKVEASGHLPQKLCEFVKDFLPYQYGIFLVEEHTHHSGCEDDAGKLLCGYKEGEMHRTSKDLVTIAADFIGVDRKAYEEEAVAALLHIRALGALREWAAKEGKAMLEKRAQP